jgi:hypothetical protein
MNPPGLIAWESRLTRLSVTLLALAAVYGIAVGAIVTMYYDVIPQMGALEDRLAAGQLVLYLLAVFAGLSHLPLVWANIQHRLWTAAALRAVVAIGPSVVFLGADGLIAHWLWWFPISETDRFHMLHHSLFAGAPLALGFGLVVQRWWRPALLGGTPSLSRKAWLFSALVLTLIVLGMGVLSGLMSPVMAGVTALAVLGALPILWRMAG